MINWVINHYSVLDFTLNPHLEEVVPTIVIQVF